MTPDAQVACAITVTTVGVVGPGAVLLVSLRGHRSRPGTLHRLTRVREQLGLSAGVWAALIVFVAASVALTVLVVAQPEKFGYRTTARWFAVLAGALVAAHLHQVRRGRSWRTGLFLVEQLAGTCGVLVAVGGVWLVAMAARKVLLGTYTVLGLVVAPLLLVVVVGVAGLLAELLAWCAQYRARPVTVLADPRRARLRGVL